MTPFTFWDIFARHRKCLITYTIFWKIFIIWGDIIPFVKYSVYVNQICTFLVRLEFFFILYFDEVVEDWTFPGWDTFMGSCSNGFLHWFPKRKQLRLHMTSENILTKFYRIALRFRGNFVDKLTLSCVLCYDGTTAKQTSIPNNAA